MRSLSRVLAIAALIATCSACYHHHLRASGERVNSSPFRKTLKPSSGGLQRDDVVPPAASGTPSQSGLPSSAECRNNGVYEVGISSFWSYAAGTVFSFGRWSRVRAEWFCAKEPPVIGPRGLGSPAPAPPFATATQPPNSKTKAGGFMKRTVHSFLWGALQQNLLPPAGSASAKTPANCKSMRQVRVSTSYGYSLITVLTAGVWSPMRVEWQCVDDSKVGVNLPRPVIPEMRWPLLSRFAPIAGPTDPSPMRGILSPKE